MKNKRKIGAMIMTGVLCLTVLTGCASEKASDTAVQPEKIQNQTAEEADASLPQFTGTSLGEFAMQDINGNSYTEEMFQDYDLTMVNVFTTWCTPCVEEIPDLDKLYQSMKDQGVNVVGVLLDVLDEKGGIIQENLETARLLAERTNATYPFLIPDDSYMNGRLIGIEGFPETFFVDKDGNIVGETYSGSGDLEYWTSIVEKELSNVRGEE